jgi:hypothetical protein
MLASEMLTFLTCQKLPSAWFCAACLPTQPSILASTDRVPRRGFWCFLQTPSFWPELKNEATALRRNPTGDKERQLSTCLCAHEGRRHSSFSAIIAIAGLYVWEQVTGGKTVPSSGCVARSGD